MTRKKDTTAYDFVDALADVIADRVVTKLAEREKPIPGPQMVPAWLDDPRRRKGERRKRQSTGATDGATVWTPEYALREAGLLTVGDPGYEEAAKLYLEWKRAHDAELHRRAQTRRAVRLLEKLIGARGASMK